MKDRKHLKAIVCFALIITALLSLSGCGNTGEKKKTEVIPIESGDDGVMGYKPVPVECPDWFDRIEIYRKFDVDGDCIWFSGAENNEKHIACYDTLNESWREFEMNTGEAENVNMLSLSVHDGVLWALLEEKPRKEELEKGSPINKDYYKYIYYFDTVNGEQSCKRLDFEGDGGSESSSPIICSIVSMGRDRALIYTPERAYLTDREASSLTATNLPGDGGFGIKVNDTLYLSSKSGVVPLNIETVSLGSPLPYEIYGGISSNTGNFYTIRKQAVCRVDMQSGKTNELFKFMDVATSSKDFSFYSGFENSKGEFYKIGGETGLTKIVKTKLPEKKPLTLACFGYTGGEYYELEQSMGNAEYEMNRELLDAVIRFNNTDPEYKIVIKPQLYANDAQRDRLLVELATGSGVDLLDTSFLPENAVDAGVLVDMLPLIDEDTDLSRDDFIEPLLELMTSGGELYEYTSRFTLLTMSIQPDLFTDREDWTVERMEQIMAENPDIQPLPSWVSGNRDELIKMFVWAMSGEFIDREAKTCSFESESFINWLRLLNEIPEGENNSDEEALFSIHYDLAHDAGWWCRNALKGDYTICGFPESSGSGTYFLKLGSKLSDFKYTSGSNVRIGIMSSGENQDGAWRFVKTLMQGSNGYIDEGIPVFKKSFEAALQNSVEIYKNSDFSFTESDADKLREQVYSTEKLASDDERLLGIISTELSAYLGGKYTPEECAAQIQSKVSIYLAE